MGKEDGGRKAVEKGVGWGGMRLLGKRWGC